MTKTLLIMAAGLGSRYGGVKQMAGVDPHHEILMEYAIYDALQAGFDKIVIVIKPDMLEECRERFGDQIERCCGVRIGYAFQTFAYNGVPFAAGRTKPMGTVHAVLSARDYLTEGTFLVINADDYYGKDAFRRAAAAMDSLMSENESAMVAYKLKNTVSPAGTVTRGICRIENGRLVSIRETYRIAVFRDGMIVSGEGETLAPETVVSMNIWAYHCRAISAMDVYLCGFLEKLPPDDNHSECLLPVMMDDLIQAGKMRTQVLTTTSKWFGITYQEDRPAVQDAFAQMYRDGLYPDELWKEPVQK